MRPHHVELVDTLIAYVGARMPNDPYAVSMLELASTLDQDDFAGSVAVGALLTRVLKGVVSEMSFRAVPFDRKKTLEAIDARNAKDPIHITTIYNIVTPYKMGDVWKDAFDGKTHEEMMQAILELHLAGYPVFAMGQTEGDLRRVREMSAE
ncbi:hypothetical protein [Tabrizicola soli]|uniref:Uncharacterized protein n=2 Tax=Tabrizicola soli TaxID=2185115 RepID=A0ABV7E219_9RHOB